MVASRICEDALSFLFRSQPTNTVEGASELEASRLLKVLTFEKHRDLLGSFLLGEVLVLLS